MKTRAIEMYLGFGSDFGTWTTEYVYIPSNTPQNELEAKAIETCKNEYSSSENFVFCGVYSIPELSDEINEVETFYYEIHVIGKNGFSTALVTENEYDVDMQADEIILEAYRNDLLHDDDCHYIDYIKEIDFDEWNEHFNFN